ncbi:hypothetical protein Tco_0554248 [Tanacetum coccineum]
MANLKFTDTHNMVAFLSKPTESEGFEQIVDFLNAHPIKYGYIKNHKKTVKNGQARTRESEEYKRVIKSRKQSQKSQALSQIQSTAVNH